MVADTLAIRGQGLLDGVEVLAAGAAKVTYRDAAGATHEVEAWRVARLRLDGTPDAFLDGLDALGDGRLEDAARGFDALAATLAAGETSARTQALLAWSRFHAANARRLQAELAGRGHAEAAAALGAYLTAHPDDVMLAPALLAQGLALLAAGDRDGATATLTRLAQDERAGPVWRLHAQVGLARVDVEAGATPKALARLADVVTRAGTTELAGEVAQTAHAVAAEARRRAGDAEGALRELPRAAAPAAGDAPLAVFAPEWLESPAAPMMLNGIGQALVALDPVGGAAAAVPFHLRVLRYHPTFHVEHARALNLAYECYRAAGQAEWAGAMRHQLRQRYPDSRWLRSAPAGAPGDR